MDEPRGGWLGYLPAAVASRKTESTTAAGARGSGSNKAATSSTARKTGRGSFG